MSDATTTARYDYARVHESARLRDALVALERGACEIVLVTDDTGHLLGVMNDGDVRRALLAGDALDAPIAPHVRRDFVSVGPRTGRAEAIELMQARALEQVPIVDENRRLVGLHLLASVVGTTTRANWAVVMAGGKGLRLRPLTENVPKPMLRVAGRPILERIVMHLVGFGIRRVFLSVNYLSDVIEKHFGDGTRFGCEITYLRESRPLGTGGALSLIAEQPTAPLLVLNGDLVSEFDVGGLLDFHAHGGHVATIGVHEYTHTVPFGVVDVDGERVTRMQEKPNVAWRTNAGIYVLNPDVVRRIPADTEYMLPTLLEQCIARGESVGAHAIEGDWIDVGHGKELVRACGQGPR